MGYFENLRKVANGPVNLDTGEYIYNRSSGSENPFIGTPYEDMWENNPYKDLYYTPSFWDNLGLSNKAKDANAEYQRLYNEYVAGIYDLQRQDEYNSPAAEVQRMSQAGINVDLKGLTGDSNTSGMSAPNAGMNPALNGQSPAGSALSSITSVLGFATSTLQQIQSIKGLSADNLAKGLTNFETFTNLAKPHIINEFANRFSGGTPNDWDSIVDVSSNSLGLSRRQSKQYKNAFVSLLSSSKYTASEQAYKNLSANDLALNHYIGKMAELSYLSQKYNYQGSISKALYDKKYFDSLDPIKASSAVNRSNESKGWLDKWRNEYYKQLYNDFKNGSQLAGLILIGSSIPAAGISSAGNLLNSIPKFGKLFK